MKVERILRSLVSSDGSSRLLDLGCGTGFIIHIAKKFVREIHGVDVTQEMLDRVDVSGDATIRLHNCDTGVYPAENEYFDLVTAYSFLHHLYDIEPTVNTAFRSLRSGGKFYADLDPNFYFWQGVHTLARDGQYDAVVKREVEMVAYKDEDIQKNFGVEKDIFNHAEFGKNIKGGFREEEITCILMDAGFSKVEFFYHLFLGQGALINDESEPENLRTTKADTINEWLVRTLPLGRNLFKYVGFVATK
jgi:ubiquinone/menaquinone biosynthesis C-methylase UbiE